LYNLLPVDVKGFDSLAELALDMHWSWNHATDQVWRRLDPDLWESTKNPWIVLQTASRQQIEQLLLDPEFCELVAGLVETNRKRVESSAWFQQVCPLGKLSNVVYFSMEFMLSEALPIYSGGLGNVAGDHLKGASDLGLPVIGVGLLYQQGYFRQHIDPDGEQQEIYPYNDPGQLPITPLRNAEGEWLRLQLDLSGYQVWVRAWQAQVGRVKLYLLDSNDAANSPTLRGITSELYGGGARLRLMQEVLLGIGGWRLLEALGIQPEVCHLNEGHAALAVLERARSYMQATGQSFDVALAVTRAGNIFTTHTAVDAGFDRFDPALVEHCLGCYASRELGISLDALMALGRLNPFDQAEHFNMAYLAIRGSGAVNAVSRLHGRVSRHLFHPLFFRWPEDQVPVGHVTNGIHTPTWDSPEADVLWTEVNGKARWLGTTEHLEENMQKLPDESFWRFRSAARASLVSYARERLSRQLAASGVSAAEVEAAKYLFDPNVLTVGFARRFASYKRPNLLLRDPARLLRLLNNPERPMQIIIAGKAHPADMAGQAMIKEWIEFIRHPEARQRIIFLSDYDMNVGERLVQGVDVWVNTPRRPWEACGTSGMKVLVNGGLNLSVLDGWWAEAYSPEVGWALGDGEEHDGAWDKGDAEELYNLLEHEVIPEFYTRNAQGIPSGWVARMRESMAHLTPYFSTCRSLREYTKKYYLPAAFSYRQRAENNGALGQALIDWRHRLDAGWSHLRFGQVNVQTDQESHVFDVQVYLDDLHPDDVRVELYANGFAGGAPEQEEMGMVSALVGTANGYAYRAKVSASRPASDYTARIAPRLEGASIPLEAGHILWQR